MLSKLIRCTKKCNNCSLHWSTEWAQFFSTTMSDHIKQSTLRKLNKWTMKFCLICHIDLTSHQPTTTSSSISTAFFRENAFATIRRQKILFKGLLNPETWIFMLQNKQTFLIGKNVLIVMVPILFNKDVLAPRYNDLKYTLQNCNYFLSTSAAKLLQSCPTLCDPRDGSPPGSPIPGILQARMLEWVAISFSNA